MRTVKIQGGLGNQLFGLAFADSVSRLGGEPVALDLASYGADRYGRAFDLKTLALELGMSEVVRRPASGGRLATLVARALAPPGYVSEAASPPDGVALAAMIVRGRYFNGYWQDEAYIARPDAIQAAVRGQVMAKSGPVSVREVVLHYRTYKEDRRAAGRRTPGGDYVRNALARIEARLGPVACVCLVSDDPALAAARVGDVGRPIVAIDGAGPWADMALLMRAKALILTNSSFSWWGGYCGDAEAIVYPSRDRYIHYPRPASRFEVI